MRIERTAKTVIAGLMSVACLASVAACGPGSSSNKANTVLLQCLFDRFGSVFPQCGLMVFPGVVIVSR